MKILITEPMEATSVADLSAHFSTHYDATLVDRRAELLAKLGDVDALIVKNRTQDNAEILAAAPRLKVVGRLGVGLDNIDLPACKARNVEVIPATGANAQSVAEYVLTTAMMLLRGAYFSTAATAAGTWLCRNSPTAAKSAARPLALLASAASGVSLLATRRASVCV